MIGIKRSGKIGQRMIGVPTRRWPIRLAVLAGVVLISAPVAVVSGMSTASATSQILNVSAQPVPGTDSLNGIACSSATYCVAVGADSGEGVIVPITDGVPGTPDMVPSTTSLTAVSCPNSNICIAVGYGPYTNPPEPTTTAGYVISISNGIWSNDWAVPGNGEPDAPDQVYLYSVGCYRGLCWGGGNTIYEGSAIVPIQDKGGPGTLESVDPFGEVMGIACPFKDFCAAVGQAISASQPNEAGTAYTIVNGKLHDAGNLPDVGFLGGIACRSTSWCVSVGTSNKETKGVVALIEKRSLDAPRFIPTATALDGVACGTNRNECLAVGVNSASKGVVVGIYAGSPGTAEVVRGAQDLNGVACPSNNSCFVVGDNRTDEGVLGKVHLP